MPFPAYAGVRDRRRLCLRGNSVDVVQIGWPAGMVRLDKRRTLRLARLGTGGI